MGRKSPPFTKQRFVVDLLFDSNGKPPNPREAKALLQRIVSAKAYRVETGIPRSGLISARVRNWRR